MKKLFALILSLAMVFSLAACGGSSSTTTETDDTDATAETSVAADAADASAAAETETSGEGVSAKIALITMDQMDVHWVRLEAAAEEKIEKLNAAGNDLELQWLAPETKDNSQQIQMIETAISSGVNYIIIACNDIIVHFAEKADLGTREQIESLIAGESVYKELQLDLTYPEIDEEPDHIWSVLFTTGYLTQQGMNDFGEYELVIPNGEIRSIFIEKIDKWFSSKIKKDTDGLNRLIDAVESGDSDEIQEYLNDCMADSISFLDGGAIEVRENFYHGMLIGMLKTNRAWRIRSNREAGSGRADIIVEPVKKRQKNFGVIIELKYAADERQLEQKAQEALEQITAKRYDEFFGIDVPPEIIHYGIAFYKKKCRVKMERVQGA